MFPKLTAAVVGTGFIGPVHVEALRRLAVRVKGTLGSSPEKSRASAEQLGLERGYASYAELLADPEVDVVHLTSPNRVHHDQVLAALAAGKHVVCEKPLAMTPAETTRLCEAASRHPHLICAVSYNLRFYPLVLHCRELIRRGELGDVLHLQGSYAQDWLLLPTDFNWRVLAEEGGDLRAIGDIGTHWLDLVRFMTGLEIDAVMADLRTVHPVRYRPAAGSVETFTGKREGAPPLGQPVTVTTEDFGTLLLRFRGGARGVALVSQVAAGRKNCVRFEISGSRRAVEWNSERPDELWIGERAEANRSVLRDPSLLLPNGAGHCSLPGGHAEGFADTFKQFYRAVYSDIAARRPSPAPAYATFADGHRELRLCEAIAASAREGRWADVLP